jgi:hypothetical protein
MQDNRQSFLENEKKVYSLLQAVYDFSNSFQGECSEEEIVEATQLPDGEVKMMLERLSINEKLVAHRCYGGGYVITEKGQSKLGAYIKELNKPIQASPSQVFNVKNMAPVEVQQFGNEHIANTTKNIGMNSSEVAQVIQGLRQSIAALSPGSQDIAEEALAVIEEEICVTTKSAKLKTALFTLWSIGKDVISLANAVTALAQRFDIHLPR